MEQNQDVRVGDWEGEKRAASMDMDDDDFSGSMHVADVEDYSDIGAHRPSDRMRH